MMYGIPAPNVPAGYPFAKIFNDVGVQEGCSPILIASIGFVETLGFLKPTAAAIVISGDGGKGVMQVTASWPPGWSDPESNIRYATTTFILPGMEQWYKEYGTTGDDLVRCVAAIYNGGYLGAQEGHIEGNVGLYTTPGPLISDPNTTAFYPDRVLEVFHILASGNLPPLP